MLHVNSNEETIAASPEKVYQVLTQFMNNDRLNQIPGLDGLETFENGCRFNVQGQVSCQLTITDQVPYSRVAYKADTDKSVSAEVAFDIVPSGDNSILRGSADIQVPFFLKGIVKGAVDKFMGTAMQYLKTAIENS